MRVWTTTCWLLCHGRYFSQHVSQRRLSSVPSKLNQWQSPKCQPGFITDLAVGAPENLDKVAPSFSFEDSGDDGNNDMEVSPYYRHDSRDKSLLEKGLLPPIANRAGLAVLLERRHDAKRATTTTTISRDDGSPTNEKSDDSSSYRQELAEIDTQLKQQYGVRVYDRPPIWTRASFAVGSLPLAVQRQNIQKLTAVMQRAFDATDHGYQQVGRRKRHHESDQDAPTDRFDDYMLDWDDFCDLDMTQIHALLSQYTRFRLSLQHERADAVRLDLHVHGVRLDDVSLQWTLDPDWDWQRNGNDNDDISNEDANSPAQQRSDFIRRLRQRGKSMTIVEYRQDTGDSIDTRQATTTTSSASSSSTLAGDWDKRQSSPPLSFILDNDPLLVEPFSSNVRQRIAQLVRQRSMALQRNEWTLADCLAWELYSTYTVTVNDVNRTWKVLGSLSADSDKSGMALPLWLQQRKQDSEWNESTRTSSVGLSRKADDGNNPTTSSTTGSFPSVLIFGDESLELNSPTRYRCSRLSEPNTQCTDIEQERVQTLIQERIHKREEGKYLEADSIRRELWYAYNVGVNDRLQQYSVGGTFDEDTVP